MPRAATATNASIVERGIGVSCEILWIARSTVGVRPWRRGSPSIERICLNNHSCSVGRAQLTQARRGGAPRPNEHFSGASRRWLKQAWPDLAHRHNEQTREAQQHLAV